jgi:peptidyl-prolyl cis-trans isomerase C
MTLKNARWGALTISIVCATALAQNVAVVNGTAVPASRAKALTAELVRQGQQESPQLDAAVREEMINREVLMQEAERKGIPNRPDIKAQLAIAQQSVVIRALIADFLKSNPPTDAEIKARYEQAVKQAGGKEYHLHHILVDNEAQAKDLIAKIKGGASFEDLAKQFSKDPGSGKNGGDLDWAAPQSYVPEFAAAAEHLKKGQLTDTPVHTQFGWHIIRLDDTRDIKVPPLEQVKDPLVKQIEQEKLQAYETGLRSHAKIQ